MSYKDIKTEIKKRIGYITLDREEKRNALGPDMIKELQEAFLELGTNYVIKVMVLRAKGKVFSAGADLAYIKQLQGNTYDENLSDSNNLKDLYLAIYHCPKPVIAQVQGHAIAGGCGLVNVCDFVFAADGAKFGYSEVHIGFIPAMVMVFLIRKVGEGRARELLLGGELITAQVALQHGLVNKIFKPEELEIKVSEFAENLAINNSATSMAATKEMISKVMTLPVEEALDYAAGMNAKARSTEDCKRGIAAFLNKEKMQW